MRSTNGEKPKSFRAKSCTNIELTTIVAVEAIAMVASTTTTIVKKDIGFPHFVSFMSLPSRYAIQ